MLPLLAIVCAVGTVALESRFSPAGAPVLSLASAGIVTLGILSAGSWEKLLQLALVFSLAFPHALAEPVFGSPIRIYAIDLLLGVIGVGALLRSPYAIKRLPLIKHFAAIIVFGLAWIVVGKLQGNSIGDALGVFRRWIIYPASFFIVLRVPSLDSKAFARVILSGGALGALLCLYRLAIGQGYNYHYFAEAKVAGRFLSYVEVIGPLLGFYYGISLLLQPQERKAKVLLSGYSVFMLLGIVSCNYRAVWVAVLVGVVLIVKENYQGALQKLFKVALISSLALAAVGVVAVQTISDRDNPLQRFSVDNLKRTTSWRRGSWGKAVEVFKSSPVVGTGFGYKHSFFYMSGKNFNVKTEAKGNTIHNDLLWVLTNGGLIGALVILSFHLRWFQLLRTRLAHSQREQRALPVLILAGYIAVGLVSMLQPVFSEPSLVFSLSALMAVALRAASTSELCV